MENDPCRLKLVDLSKDFNRVLAAAAATVFFSWIFF